MKSYLSEAISSRLYVLRQLPLAGWGLVTALIAVDLVLGLLPVGFVLATSVLIGRAPAAVSAGLGSAQWGALVSAFLVSSALFFGQQLLTPVQASLGELMKHRVNGYFHRRLIAVALRSTGIGPMENQAVLERLRQASETLENSWRTPGHAASGMLAYLTRYSRLAGFCVIIAVVAQPWAALAVLASTMCFRFGQRGPSLLVYMRLWPVVGPIRRERDYFRDLGMLAPAAKEIRIFGLADWVIGRYRVKAEESLAPLWRERRRYMMYHFLWYTLIGLLIDCTVLALIGRSAAAGHLSLTELALGLQATIAAILLGEHYHESDASTQYGMQAAKALDQFEELATAHADAEMHTDIDKDEQDDVTRNDQAVLDATGTPRQSIRFADVSFGYEGSHRTVLNGLELTLQAGQCTAIVGLNGAGKTTLVKLLARLYEPTGGALLIDGHDARSFPVDAWRRQIGVIFQDFNRYELSVSDNITFGAIERPVLAESVRAAASRAGMTDVVDRLPHGFDTMLSRQYEDGAELSGGQWQRIAIARALYAVDSGARVLILDEPTAALDVRSEAAFFQEFAELTRGLTTVLISHRFSSVRQADRIVVLEHGRVVEDGTHESLLADGGHYAQLFQLQAERFASGLDAEGEPIDPDGSASAASTASTAGSASGTGGDGR